MFRRVRHGLEVQIKAFRRIPSIARVLLGLGASKSLTKHGSSNNVMALIIAGVPSSTPDNSKCKKTTYMTDYFFCEEILNFIADDTMLATPVTFAILTSQPVPPLLCS